MARNHGMGLVLESPTWRANPDWAARLGYGAGELTEANLKAIDLLREIRGAYEDGNTRVVISGNLGPRGDGYTPEQRMGVTEARAYHGPQIATFARTDADLVTAMTMNYPEEAIGIVLAARDHHMPVVISFTVETDGRLPSGETLGAAITRCDDETGAYPVYYMINCAHPDHFAETLREGDAWRGRIGCLRANASRLSHAELDRCTELDDGDPEELGGQYAELRALLPALSVVGGCCGTDHRHVDAMCRSLARH